MKILFSITISPMNFKFQFKYIHYDLNVYCDNEDKNSCRMFQPCGKTMLSEKKRVFLEIGRRFDSLVLYRTRRIEIGPELVLVTFRFLFHFMFGLGFVIFAVDPIRLSILEAQSHILIILTLLGFPM